MMNATKRRRVDDTPPDLFPCPSGKRRFESRSIADVAARIRERWIPLRVYRCHLCANYHLTKKDAAPAWNHK